MDWNDVGKKYAERIKIGDTHKVRGERGSETELNVTEKREKKERNSSSV